MIKEEMSSAIGGYIELELPKKEKFLHYDSIHYQSARAAFRSLLQAVKPKKVWLPKHICNAMLTPLLDEGIDVSWYDLDENLMVLDSIVLKKNELLLYVNYYGVCQFQVSELLQKFNENQIVLDFSQAYFDPPELKALATIYSARKFFGVPDGGFLVTDVTVKLPELKDNSSINRMQHLLKRLYIEPESGYLDYLSSEKSLTDTTPKTVSGLTRRLLESIDFETARSVRYKNFNHLHKRLQHTNNYLIDYKNLVAPLCYPYMTNNNKLRRKLINNRVFAPLYWGDALERVDKKWGRKFIYNMLPLPLDQRYGELEMRNLLKLVLE